MRVLLLWSLLATTAVVARTYGAFLGLDDGCEGGGSLPLPGLATTPVVPAIYHVEETRVRPGSGQGGVMQIEQSRAGRPTIQARRGRPLTLTIRNNRPYRR